MAYLDIEAKEREREQKRAEAAATPSKGAKPNTPNIPPTF